MGAEKKAVKPEAGGKPISLTGNNKELCKLFKSAEKFEEWAKKDNFTGTSEEFADYYKKSLSL